jgi:ADP-ribose pyrophosphatase YjhB (NUDIX family)
VVDRYNDRSGARPTIRIKAMPRPQTPLLAADTIIELTGRPGRPIVLIERRYPPYGWAIPGGSVDVGEPLEAAAVREALEETALQVTLRALLGLYSDPRRDPRGHTVTAVYVGEASSRFVARGGQWQPSPQLERRILRAALDALKCERLLGNGCGKT